MDRTPPTCMPPSQKIGGVPLDDGNVFSLRAGFSAAWTCTDNESSVVFSRWMPRAKGAEAGPDSMETALFARALQHVGGVASGGLVLPLTQDMIYRSCVYAENGATEGSGWICAGEVTFDGTPPVSARSGEFALDDNGGARFLLLQNETLCTTWPGFVDATSGIAHISLELLQISGDDELLHGNAVDLGPAAANGGSICRVLTPPLLQGVRYFSRLTVSNGAVPPLVTVKRSRGFILDRTEASVGTVSLFLRYPVRFELQPGFPHNVTGLRLRAVMTGFSDRDSGLISVDLVVVADGVEIMRSTVSGAAGETVWDAPRPLALMRNGTRLTVSAIATNGVGLRSKETTSAPRHVHLVAISLDKISLLGALDEPSHVLKLDSGAWLSFTRATDPMDANARFEYNWSIATAPCTDDVSLSGERTDGLLPQGLVPSWTFSMAERSRLRLANLSGVPSDAFLTRAPQAPLVHGTSYCALLSACTRPSSSFETAVRCVTVGSTSKLLDDSGPVASAQVVKASVAQAECDYGRFCFSLRVACHDSESGVGGSFLRLSASGGTRLTLEVTPRLRSNEIDEQSAVQLMNATEGVQLSTRGGGVWEVEESSGAELSMTSENASGFVGMLHISVDAIDLERPPDDVDGTYVSMVLICSNLVGVHTEASTGPVLFDREPPSITPLQLAGLVWSAVDDAWLAAPLEAPQQISLTWPSLRDTQLPMASLSICVGSEPFSCSMHNETLPGSSSGALLRLNLSSVSIFHVAVGATDMSGNAGLASTRVHVDGTPPLLGSLIVNNQSWATEVDIYETRFEVGVVGGAHDDETDDVRVRLSTQAHMDEHGTGGNTSCRFTMQSPSWRWEARCVFQEATTRFCVAAYAYTPLHASATSTVCIRALVRAPVIKSVHLQREDDRLALHWPGLLEPTAAFDTLWVLCTYDACTSATVSPANRTEAVVPADHALLDDYRGQVWAQVWTRGGDGLLLSTPTVSNALIIAKGGFEEPGTVDVAPRPYLSSLAELVIFIGGFVDPLHGTVYFQWCVGSNDGGSDLLPCQNQTVVPTRIALADYSAQIVDFAGPYTAYVTATACTAYSCISAAASDVVTIDQDDPIAGAVDVGLGSPTEDTSWAEKTAVIACSHAGGETSCSASPLVDDSDSPFVRQMKTDRLQSLMAVAANTTLAPFIAARWAGFEDTGSGLARVELCFGTAAGASDLVPCTPVMNYAAAATSDHPLAQSQEYYATVRAYDRVGRVVSVVSRGFYHAMAISSSGGGLQVMQVESGGYQSDCRQIGMAWTPVTQACAADVEHRLQICSAEGRCGADVAIAVDGGFESIWTNVSIPSALRPGMAFSASLTASGCSGVMTRTVGPLMCDDTAPKVINAPTLLGAEGESILLRGGRANVSWAGVFVNEQSPIVAVAVCVRAASSSVCDWLDAGLSSQHMQVSLTVLHPNTTRAVALVSATNGAGLTSVGTSSEITIDSSFPVLSYLQVGSFRSSGDSQVALEVHTQTPACLATLPPDADLTSTVLSTLSFPRTFECAAPIPLHPSPSYPRAA